MTHIEIHSNHSNLAFDREIDNSKAWLLPKITGVCGHGAGTLLDCLMQRIVEVSLCPYALAVRRPCKTTENCFPTPGTKINCTRAHLETGSGHITVSPKHWLANQGDFLLHWAYCLIAIFAAKKSCSNVPATLVFDIGEENLFRGGNDEQFINYCRQGPIVPLRHGKRFIVQSTSKNAFSCDPKFTYTRKPLIHLFSETAMGISGKCRLFLNHCVNFLAYMAATIRLPQLSLLGRDIAYSSIFLELNRRGLIDSVVLTVGSYHSQPLWVRELPPAKVHMVWYSQSAEPIIYASDNIATYIPNFRWIWAGVHWVWTQSFAKYIGTFARDAAIKAVGPIVWYMPKIKAAARDVLRVAIIDVPPFDDGIALLNGVFPNYYNAANLHSFIKDITSLRPALEQAFHLPISFVLKPKRAYNSTTVNGHAVEDRGYSDYLKELATLKCISLKHPSENLYSMISESHLAIVYPFSSPAYVAEYLNIPSIYYDPTRTITRHDFGDSPSLIYFANHPEDLLNTAILALSDTVMVVNQFKTREGAQ